MMPDKPPCAPLAGMASYLLDLPSGGPDPACRPRRGAVVRHPHHNLRRAATPGHRAGPSGPISGGLASSPEVTLAVPAEKWVTPPQLRVGPSGPISGGLASSPVRRLAVPAESCPRWGADRGHPISRSGPATPHPGGYAQNFSPPFELEIKK